MGTLGKAAGVGGAFVLAHEVIIEWLIQRARSYIYTTAAPPLLAHALLTAIKIIRSPEGQQRRENIALRMQEIEQSIPKDKFIVTKAQSAIFPLIVGDNETTLELADYLYAHHIWVPAIRPPTVPMNTARLRLTVSALHTSQDIQQLMLVLKNKMG
jgi:8-amino-7-oxononanoate synthase